MGRARLRLLAALTAVSIAGCDSNSDDEGANPPTGDIQLGVNLDASDDVTVRIRAVLYWPYFEELRLGAGNTLTACVGTTCKPLTWGFGYEASLPYVAETAYTISLARLIDVSAPNTFGTLPVPFTILAPAAGSQVTDGEMITLLWSPAGISNTRTHASGFAACWHRSGETTSRVINLDLVGDPDLGTLSFDMAYILSPRPWPTPRDANLERCDVKLTVSMSRTGVADSAFRAGSHVFSHIERSVTIKYTP